MDLATGDDLWHADRTFGHQSNDLTAVSTWRDGDTGVVAMNQLWTDSVSGTPYFQWIGRVTQLDVATGGTRLSENYAAPVPPLEAGGWVYFPRAHVVLLPIGSGNSEITSELVARPLAGGSGFTVPLNSPIQLIRDIASDGENLHIRTSAVMLTVPAYGCGQPTCAPRWTDAAGGVVSSAEPIAIGTQSVFNAHGSTISAFSRTGCGAPRRTAIWTATVGSVATGLAVTAERVT